MFNVLPWVSSIHVVKLGIIFGLMFVAPAESICIRMTFTKACSRKARTNNEVAYAVYSDILPMVPT